jgi:ribosomal protein S18 acetylase RimI-like enzyme
MDERLTRVKADIVPYTAEYSRTVLSWIDDEETLENLSRDIDYPPPEDLIESWQREGISSYLLMSDGKPVAYGEIWPRPLLLAVEIAHLLVDPVMRGRGLGTKMVNMLFDRGAQRPGVAKVMITFHSGDEAVLGCYVKAGFELVSLGNAEQGLRMERAVRI